MTHQIAVPADDLQAADQTERCAARVQPWGDCPHTATVTIAFGCVHEHVRTRRVCPCCLTGLKAGRGACGHCLDGPDPHHCLLLVREVPS